MSSSAKRSPLILAAALAGTLALAAPAMAGLGLPAGPVTGPLPPPPIPPEEIEQVAAELNSRIADDGAQASTLPVPGITPPDPTDFGAITPDPADYGIPDSAERFREGDEYVIPGPTPGGEGAGVTPEGLEGFYNQQVTWSSCDDFNGSDELECAYVIAPLDYSDPGGETIALAISRAPATSGEAIGSVLVNPGGPGSPGIDLAGAAFFAELNQRFDVVGFDPRGVGSSLPMIRCQSNEAWDWQRQGSDRLSGEELNAILEYNTNECYQNTGAIFGVDNLIDHVGTVNVVQDLDLIRSVLGDPKINYIGFSYGTSIGYEYSRQFPDNIRALVIDGVVDVLENNPEERQKYEEFQVGTSENGTIAQIAGFQATFEQFLEWCATDLGEECALVDPEGANEVEDLLGRYQAIARQAWGGQTYETEDGRPLSFEDFNQGTIMAMYSSSLWAPLNAGLAEIQADPTNDYFMMALSDIYAGREDDGSYSLDLAAFPTIWCTDSGPEPGFNEDVAGQIEFIEDYFAAAPFTDPRTEEEPERGMTPAHDWCTYYEENFTLPTAESLTAMPNILAISTTYDSATPFDQGVVASAAIGGTLLIAAGNDHTSYGGPECVTQITNEYFLTLRVPTDIPGEEGVRTKDVHSNVVTGDQCTVVKDFRPVTQLASGEGEPGQSVDLPVEGLVRNSEYVVSWKYGSLPLTSDVEGTGVVTVEIPADAQEGPQTLVLTPGIDGENDPTIRAEATLQILPAGSEGPGGPGDGDGSEDADGSGDADGSEDGDGTDPGDQDGTDGSEGPSDEDSDDTGTLPDGDLEETGVKVGTIVAIAVALVVIGGAVALITRRKSS